MKRYVFFFIFGFSLLLSSAPYKPYPILFVHGYNSNSSKWGAGTYVVEGVRTDSLDLDSIPPESTYAHFLSLMTPYVKRTVKC